MDLSVLKQGDEVIVFENYGRTTQRHVVDNVSRWAIEMKDGASYSCSDFPRDKKIVLVDSPEYRRAIEMYEAQKALHVLSEKDAIDNPEILAALKKCLALLGEEEVKTRHDMLVSMSVVCSQDTYLYRTGTMKEVVD